jgi:glutamate racemase
LNETPSHDRAHVVPASGFLGDHTHIGVFDSGLGGLSVLRALRDRLPLADLSYVADSGYAPYGERDTPFILSRSADICDFLLAQRVDAIVVACNTATAAAIHDLRVRHPHVPIVGVEPGVKPAVAQSRNKKVGVMATPSTLASAKYKRLIETHGQGAQLVSQPCPGLAAQIESGELDTPALRALVDGCARPLREAGVDTVVLGCTHYPFVMPLLTQTFGSGVRIVDTALAVAEHAAHRCADQLAQRPPEVQRQHSATNGRLRFWTSGDPIHLASVVKRWLGLDCRVDTLDSAPLLPDAHSTADRSI